MASFSRTIFRALRTKKLENLRPLICMFRCVSDLGLHFQTKFLAWRSTFLDLGGSHARQSIQKVAPTQDTKFLKLEQGHGKAFENFVQRNDLAIGFSLMKNDLLGSECESIRVLRQNIINLPR